MTFSLRSERTCLVSAPRPDRVGIEVSSRLLAPGDALRGRVTLTVAMPFDGLRLLVRLSATQRTVGRAPGKLALSYKKEVVWQRETALDGERVYRDGASYPFELLAPDATVAASTGELEWTVTALLEHAWKPALKHAMKVKLVERPASTRQRPARRRTRSTAQ